MLGKVQQCSQNEYQKNFSQVFNCPQMLKSQWWWQWNCQLLKSVFRVYPTRPLQRVSQTEFWAPDPLHMSQLSSPSRFSVDKYFLSAALVRLLSHIDPWVTTPWHVTRDTALPHWSPLYWEGCELSRATVAEWSGAVAGSGAALVVMATGGRAEVCR